MAGKFENKRRWWEGYSVTQADRVFEPKQEDFSFKCPCCGYPTLPSPNSFDICCLCGWQDDGQDDPRADEVWGGPNGRYSLTEARTNFQRYWVKFNPDTDPRPSAGDSAVILIAKEAIVAAFKAMESASEPERAQLWETVKSSRKTLRSELLRSRRERDQRRREDATPG